jgi:hexokinase
MASISIHPGELKKDCTLDGRAARLAAVLLAAITLSGCQSISMNSAQLRVIDASPDSGVIDSYQNNSALAYNLGFGTMTSYIPMSPGAYSLVADKAGTRQTLVASNDMLVAGKQYTEIVGNSLVNLQQTVLLDQSTPAPPVKSPSACSTRRRVLAQWMSTLFRPAQDW